MKNDKIQLIFDFCFVILVLISLLFLSSCSSIQEYTSSIETNVGVTEYDMSPCNYYNDPGTYNMWWDIYNKPYLDGKIHCYVTAKIYTDKDNQNTVKSFMIYYRQNF